MPEVRLIDAIELVRYLCGACPSHQNGECIDKMCWKYEDRARIENAPTIESVPVRHGRWTDNGEDKFICSACKGYVYRWFGKSDFCPRCGADMREGGADI